MSAATLIRNLQYKNMTPSNTLHQSVNIYDGNLGHLSLSSSDSFTTNPLTAGIETFDDSDISRNLFAQPKDNNKKKIVMKYLGSNSESENQNEISQEVDFPFFSSDEEPSECHSITAHRKHQGADMTQHDCADERKDRNRVHFGNVLVTKIHYIPKISPEDFSKLYYSCHELQR